MSFGSFAKNLGSKIGTGIETMAQERARRLNNPAFQETLRRSRDEFANHLSNTANHGWNAVCQSFVATFGLTWTTLEDIFDDKVKKREMVLKAFRAWGTLGIEIGQTIWHGGKLAGRGGLHTLRWLFAK